MGYFSLSSATSLSPRLHPFNNKECGRHRGGRKLAVVFSSSSADRFDAQERIDIKVEKLSRNTNRAARKAVTTVLQVDRARLADLDSISRKSARLLPRALLETLMGRIQDLEWDPALKVFGLLRRQEWYDANEEIYLKVLVMLAKCRQPDKALEIFEMMLQDKLSPSVRTLTALLSSYVNSKRTSTAFRLFGYMKKIPEYQPDVYTYSLMIQGCCVCGLFDKASLLLVEMQDSGVKPNIVTFNTLINAFGKVGMLSEVEELFVYMSKYGKCRPDSWTWNIIIKHYGSTGNIKKMEEWFDNLQAAGVQPDIVTLNTLVLVYGKNKMYGKMRSVVRYMNKYLYSADLCTFNTILDAYGKGGMIEDMDRTFVVMKRRGIKFTAFTLSCLINAYSKEGMWDAIDKVRRQWKNSDLVPDVALYNSLMNAYQRAGNFDDMEGAFLQMKEEGLIPDEISLGILSEARKHQQKLCRKDEISLDSMDVQT